MNSEAGRKSGGSGWVGLGGKKVGLVPKEEMEREGRGRGQRAGGVLCEKREQGRRRESVRWSDG